MNSNRRLWKYSLVRLMIAGMVVFLIGACVATPSGAPGKGNISGRAVVPAEKTGLFTGPPADAVMLNEGVSWLGLSDKPVDYARARQTFAALTADHPKSRWRPLAETFIHLIDAAQSLQARELSAQALTEKLQQENGQLKKDIQSLGARYSSERVNLMQENEQLKKENEQLKKDMELLRKLEVQLDQREKMLR